MISFCVPLFGERYAQDVPSADQVAALAVRFTQGFADKHSPRPACESGLQRYRLHKPCLRTSTKRPVPDDPASKEAWNIRWIEVRRLSTCRTIVRQGDSYTEALAEGFLCNVNSN